MSLAALVSRLRQWRFAPEFRIEADGSGADLAHVLAEALRVLRRPVEAPKVKPLSPELAVGLCNELFRLRRNAEQLAAEGRDSKELRSIRRALSSLEETLKQHGIECLDPTGQDYDPGRLDFEQIGQAEVLPGIERERIGRCERPAVLMDGKLAQKARGLVHRPSAATGPAGRPA